MDINIYNLQLSPTFIGWDLRKKQEYASVLDESIKLDIEKKANYSRNIRKKQIDQLLTHIDKDKINIILGDFNICKFFDNKEYTDIKNKMKTKNMAEMLINKLPDNGLVIDGTYTDLVSIDKNSKYFEFLDYAFISNTHVDNFEAIFEKYIKEIDHKPCRIIYKNK